MQIYERRVDPRSMSAPRMWRCCSHLALRPAAGSAASAYGATLRCRPVGAEGETLLQAARCCTAAAAGAFAPGSEASFSGRRRWLQRRRGPPTKIPPTLGTRMLDARLKPSSVPHLNFYISHFPCYDVECGNLPTFSVFE